jgi:hypothetical protein
VRQAGQVPVVPLVNSLQPEKIRRNTSRSCRTLRLPSEGGCVVRERMDGALTTVHVMDQNVMLSNGSSELEIRVGDGAGGIVAAYNSLLYLQWKRGTPEERVRCSRGCVTDKEDSSHTGAGGIGGTDRCRWCVDQFA